MTTENKPYMQAMQDLRRSSAAQRHTPKKFKGSRSTNKSRAIKEAS